MEPCSRTPTPSNATEPIAASTEVWVRTRMSAAKDATSEKIETKSCDE